MQRSLSFGSVARQYDDFRPALPDEFVQWLGLPPTSIVLDLAAGTGLATRTLERSGARVIAVEPDDEMRSVLVERSPHVEALAGTAEHIPLEDNSVDAVVIVSAWHWVKPDEAFREIARVLHDDGTLAIAWNGANYTAQEVGELWALRQSTDDGQNGGAQRHDPKGIVVPPDVPFTDVETALLHWQWPRSVDQIVAWMQTHSGVITATPEQATAINEEARERAVAMADASGIITLPMATRCWRARRSPR
jgi:SAM-dependent methyltransferase